MISIKNKNVINLVFIYLGAAVQDCTEKILYLEAKEELTNRVTDADPLLSTGTTPQFIYDDQGPVTHIVDYVRDL